MQQELHLQYCSSNKLLLVNNKGQIKVLYTPFRVISVEAINNIPLNTWVYVEEVFGNSQDQLQYVIHGYLYLYKHFHLPIKF